MSSYRSSSHKSKNSSDSSGSLSKLLNFSKSVEKGIFGVLFAMTKNNTFPKYLTIISIVIEFIQLISFGFKKVFPWGGDFGYYLKRIISPVSHPADVLSYDGFTIMFWVAIGLMLCGFSIIWYVAYKSYQNKIANIWIIRILRWFVSFTVSVLYIPLISLFLIGLNCEKDPDGEDNSRMILARFVHDDILCYGTKNIAITIFSIIYIIIFTIIAVSSSLTYYEYDTNVSNRFAKPHARFDLTILFVKTVYAFFFELLRPYPWLLAITFFVGMIWISFGSILFLPYVNQRLNQIKSGLYTIILWVSLCTIFTMAVGDDESPATSYLVVAGLIPTFFIGFFGSKFFYKFLANQLKQLNSVTPQSSVQTLEIIGKAMSNDSSDEKKKNSVKFEEPSTLGSKRQIRFPFFSRRYVFPFFVEIMGRKFLRGNREGESIEKCNLLYQCALQYFPESSMLWMAYCNFLFTVRSDRHVGYAALEKLRRMEPSFDIRFFIFQRDREREQMMDSDLRGPDSGAKIQDFVTYMEFKKLYLGARKAHQSCLNYIRRFWRHLLHETIDLQMLSHLSGKIATTETKARELYERLLGLNPNSVRVIRDYAQFVEEVVKDNDLAFRLRKKADTIEDHMSKSLSTEHIKSVPVGDMQIQSDDDKAFSESGAIPMETMGGTKLAGDAIGTHNRSRSGDSTSETSSSYQNKGKHYETFQQSNSISRLSWLMIATTLLTVIFSIACLVVLRNEMVAQRDGFQGILSIGDAALESVSIAKNFVGMQLAGMNNQVPTFNALKDRTERRLNILENIHHAVYWGEKSPQSFVNDNMASLKRQAGISVFDVGSEVFSYSDFNKTNPANSPLLLAIYNEPVVNMSSLLLIGHTDNQTLKHSELLVQPYNAWKAANLYVETAREMLLKNISYFEDGYDEPFFRFITENGASTLAQAFLQIQTAYIATQLQKSSNIASSIFYIWLVIFGLLLILGVFLFRPIVSRISREKIRTLILFTMAPLDLVRRMSTRKVKLASLDSGSDRDIIFESSEDEAKTNRSNHHLVSDNESVTSASRKHTIQQQSKLSGSTSNLNLSANNNNNNSGDKLSTIVSGSPASSKEDDMRPLMLSDGMTPRLNGMGGDYISSSSNNVIITQGDNSCQDLHKPSASDGAHVAIPIGGWDGKNKRNMNKRSLRIILRRLHISYSFALFFIFGIITMGLFVSFSKVYTDMKSGFTIAYSSHRSVDARIVEYYVQALLLPEELVDRYPALIGNATFDMNFNHQSLVDIPATQSLMDGSLGCWSVNASKCRTISDPYYPYVSNGLDWLIEQFIQTATTLAALNRTEVDATAPEMVWMKTLETDVYDGLDRATFDYFQYWQGVQAQSITVITAIMSVTTVLLAIIYAVLFRPFINRLRIQHIHTLAMLRLAPEDLQYMEVSDKVIDED